MRQRDIHGKVDFLLDNFNKIDVLKKYALDELNSNFERVDSVIHRLQTSIDALLDIGRYIIADLGLNVPNTSSQVLDILSKEGFLTSLDIDKYIKMIGFRNRVVHEYESVDIRLLHRILQENSDDLKQLLATFLEIIKKKEDKKDYGGLRFL